VLRLIVFKMYAIAATFPSLAPAGDHTTPRKVFDTLVTRRAIVALLAVGISLRIFVITLYSPVGLRQTQYGSIHTVGKELLRYIAPYAVMAPPDSGIDPEGMSFGSTVPANQGQSPTTLSTEFAQGYSGVGASLPSQGIREMLGSYQEIFRLSGLPTVVLVALTIVGLFISKGNTRRALWLFFALAAYLYIAPVALSSYDVRYGVPAGLLLSIAGSLGGWLFGYGCNLSPLRHSPYESCVSLFGFIARLKLGPLHTSCADRTEMPT
jgi:hypothetical protein